VTNIQNKHFDALIVGGGIIGMLSARNLHNKGLKVAVVDKGKLGGEATWAAGGILSALNPWQASTAAHSLLNEGISKFAELANELQQETNIDAELVQSGMLVLDGEEKQQVSDQELLAKEPNLANSFNQALYLPHIQQIRPPRLINALYESLKSRGIAIFENTSVTDLLVNNNNISGVATSSQNFHSEKVILCSGAWTNKFLQQNINIEPVRGQMLLYKPSKKLISHIILKQKSYLLPRQDGHILCGSTVEHVGFNNKVTQQGRKSLQNIAHELVPALENYQPIKQWSALRPGTGRDVPYICKHPDINGLYLNSGHYRYGIIMSIASCRIISELVSNSYNPSQIAAFSY